VATTKAAYASSASITITLNSLGSGSARESTAIDNTSNLYLDAHVRVTVNVGSVTGAPQALVYAYGSEDGSLYPDTVTGSDAGITLENPTVIRLAATIPTPTGSKAYESDVFSIARLYGGVLPRKWGIVVVNSTGAALSGSGNSASYTGINLTAA
jgi:hypothetical protein